MSGLIIIPNFMPALDSNGNPISGALIYFYLNRTTIPTTVYSDAALLVPLSNPVVADSAGVFPYIYAEDNELFTVTTTGPNGENPRTYDDVNASVGVPNVIVVPYTPGDAADAIQAGIVAAGQYGTVILSRGDYTARRGVIDMLTGQTLTSETGASIKLLGPLSGSEQLLKANGRQNITIKNITFDGDCTTVKNVIITLVGAITQAVVAGYQYRVAMRAAVAATLTLTGPIAAPVVMTGTGMTPGSTVVYAYITALTDGTLTLTPSGNVNYVAIHKNGGQLSDLLNFNTTNNIKIENVKLVNVDTLGIATNFCNNVDIEAYVQRPVASWDQTVGILCIGGATYGPVLIRSGTQVYNTGTGFLVKQVTIEDGVICYGTGYGASFVTYVGSGNATIGKVITGPNQAWEDLDATVPSIMELQGEGTIDSPTILSNYGGGIYIAGPWRIIQPYIFDTNAYFAAAGSYTGAGITFGYAGPTISSEGSEIIGGTIGDTRVGTARTQGYAIADQNSSVNNTRVYDVRALNNRTGRFNFLGTVERAFRGLRHTFSETFDPPSIASPATYVRNLTATDVRATWAVVSQTLGGSVGGLQILPASPGTDIITATLLNVSGAPVDATSAIVTVIVEEGPGAT